MAGGIKVLKFGGTSLGTVARIRSVASIISDAALDFQPIVIVSALEGMTDRLVRIADEAERDQAEAGIQQILDDHLKTAKVLLSKSEATVYRGVVDQERIRLWRRIALGRSSEIIRDEILATGERLSAPLVAALLRCEGLDATAWDSSGIIRTDSTFGEAVVDWVTTRESILRWHTSLDSIAVVTGFIGADGSGRTTTLGRGGSDYSAAIFASALDASVLERWTDVDGIYTSDPAVDRRAKRLSRLKADEACSWNRSGRIGMHRDALDPVSQKGIPVHVRSTFAPDREGTWILPGTNKRPTRRQAG